MSVAISIPASDAETARLHPLKIAERLAADFAQTAIERDRRGGTAKRERDLLRQSGLLNLLVPSEFGGSGSDWPEILKIVRIFSRVDSSLAHLFGFQHLLLATIELFGTEEQRALNFEETVRNSWFWGNALNPLDLNTHIVKAEDRHLISGRKGFCSGATDSDRLVISAWDPVDSKLIVGVIPSDRAGLRIKQDWDNFGQRQTDSGTVEFLNVELHEDEILKNPGPLGERARVAEAVHRPDHPGEYLSRHRGRRAGRGSKLHARADAAVGHLRRRESDRGSLHSYELRQHVRGAPSREGAGRSRRRYFPTSLGNGRKHQRELPGAAPRSILPQPRH